MGKIYDGKIYGTGLLLDHLQYPPFKRALNNNEGKSFYDVTDVIASFGIFF